MAIASIPKLVAAPGLIEPKFGLLSVIQWQDSSDVHTQLGVQFEPLECGPAALTNGLFCADTPGTPEGGVFGVPKVTEAGVPLVVGSPFAVYGSYQCSAPGRPTEDAFDRAREHLRTGRGRAIEEAFQLGAAGNEPNLVDEAVDITPSLTAVSLTEAIATLEQYIHENYGGTGVIHLSPRLAVLAYAARLVIPDGDVLRTVLGTPVAVGAGYDLAVGPDGNTTTGEDAWVYATGAVYGWQSEVGMFPDDLSGALNMGNNNLIVLAEQVFTIAYDCAAAAVGVDTTP